MFMPVKLITLEMYFRLISFWLRGIDNRACSDDLIKLTIWKKKKNQMRLFNRRCSKRKYGIIKVERFASKIYEQVQI